MNRALLLVCAVAAGVLVFRFHATAPDCEGWYCLDLSEEPAAVQQAAPADSGQSNGAVPDSSGGAPQPLADSQVEDRAVPVDPPPAAAVDAPSGAPVSSRAASEDKGQAPRPSEYADTKAFDDEGGPGRMGEETETPAAWTALATTALEDPDPEMRATAISDVGLRRDAEAVEVLLEAAANDTERENRLQALQSLWYSAADGLDTEDRRVMSLLEAARNDPDDDIADLAKRAIADLEALEELEALAEEQEALAEQDAQQ